MQDLERSLEQELIFFFFILPILLAKLRKILDFIKKPKALPVLLPDL